MTTLTTSRDDLDYLLFQRRIKEKTGIDLSGYKRPQMERRLRALATSAGARSFREYAALLERDPKLLETFRSRVTINVSELFRNPDKFHELKDTIIPALARDHDRLRIWSAGCSYGAEAYSVAIILHELFGPAAQRHLILATDIDDEMLGLARQGRFSDADMKNVDRARRARFFLSDAHGWRAAEPLRQMIDLKRHDLLTEPFERDFDLILCRNVVIYFTDEAKARLYRKFRASLAPGGMLFIGSTEHIFSAREIGLEPISSFLYRTASVAPAEDR
jgi:chemotaxis protein methyltransferase CheR